ncbi:hypothetical protein FB446DRAFT_720204 [Lentinula raphanica]|nr:hypothetical protein FB446DRAFT_720204 [Lentinula raphanica]
MTRSTTRALALLLLGGSISSSVLSAPTSISSRSMSSSPILNGAQTPEIPTSCARLPGSRSRSGPNPHRRRGVHANIVPRRVLDGDDLAVQTSERNVNRDANVSVLEGRADSSGSDSEWDLCGSDQEKGRTQEGKPSGEKWDMILELDPARHKEALRKFELLKERLKEKPNEHLSTKMIHNLIGFIKVHIIADQLTTEEVQTEAEEIVGKLEAKMEETTETKETKEMKGKA